MVRDVIRHHGDPPKPLASRDVANYQIVSPEYFRVLDVPIVAGRGLTDADTGDTPRVGLVSEAFAARYLGGRNPIGMHLDLPRMMFRPVSRGRWRPSRRWRSSAWSAR